MDNRFQSFVSSPTTFSNQCSLSPSKINERAPMKFSQGAKRQFKEDYYSRDVLATVPLLLKLKDLISKKQTRFLFTLKQNKLKFILHQILLPVQGQLQLLKYSEVQGKCLSKSHRTTGPFLRGILTLRNS